MSFKEKYTITQKHLTSNTKRRSGLFISPTVKFIVAHDTGNPKSTAKGNVAYYENTNNDAYASAHIFVDDKEIIECIPAITTDKPEKAWHVRYNMTKDNELYGFEANDVAIGVEYCYGDNINSDEAYKRYIWVIAYICFKYKLDPRVVIVGHHLLDPGRKSDPVSGLKYSNRSYEQLLKDIVTEYETCKEDIKEKQENIPIINKKSSIQVFSNSISGKVYAVGDDIKKHWIINEESFNIGKGMGLWEENLNTVKKLDDDKYEEGEVLVFIKI